MVKVSRIIVLKNNHMKSEFSGKITLALARVCATARFQIWKFNRIKEQTAPPALTSATAFDTRGNLTRPAANCVRSTWDSVTATMSPRCAVGPRASWSLTFLQTSDTLKKTSASDPPHHHNSWCYSTGLGATPPPWPFRGARVLWCQGAPSRRRAHSRPGDTSPPK